MSDYEIVHGSGDQYQRAADGLSAGFAAIERARARRDSLGLANRRQNLEEEAFEFQKQLAGEDQEIDIAYKQARIDSITHELERSRRRAEFDELEAERLKEAMRPGALDDPLKALPPLYAPRVPGARLKSAEWSDGQLQSYVKATELGLGDKWLETERARVAEFADLEEREFLADRIEALMESGRFPDHVLAELEQIATSDEIEDPREAYEAVDGIVRGFNDFEAKVGYRDKRLKRIESWSQGGSVMPEEEEAFTEIVQDLTNPPPDIDDMSQAEYLDWLKGREYDASVAFYGWGRHVKRQKDQAAQEALENLAADARARGVEIGDFLPPSATDGGTVADITPLPGENRWQTAKRQQLEALGAPETMGIPLVGDIPVERMFAGGFGDNEAAKAAHADLDVRTQVQYEKDLRLYESGSAFLKAPRKKKRDFMQEVEALLQGAGDDEEKVTAALDKVARNYGFDPEDPVLEDALDTWLSEGLPSKREEFLRSLKRPTKPKAPVKPKEAERSPHSTGEETPRIWSTRNL